MSDFGTALREARERRGITLRQIADHTKISIASLEALERSDASRLPGGIFARSFVRSYAVEVGLDPDATVEAFLDRFSDDARFADIPGTAPAEPAPASSLRFRSGQALRRRSGQAPHLAGMVLKLLVLGLVAIGIILYFTVINNAPDQSPDQRPDSARRATRRVAVMDVSRLPRMT
jgi:cytoskeletal protein RodZ